MNDTRFDRYAAELGGGDMAAWLRANSGDNREQLDRLLRNLRTARRQELTPRQQQMVELYFDEGLKVTEIARLLGLHHTTVSRTLVRAKERLRRCLRYGF